MLFQKAIDRVLGHEGGYVNNPADPGGETNWGIAKRWHADVDIKNLTRDGAVAIYEKEFWDPLGEIDSALKFQMLDSAVNHGIPNTNRFLQRAVGVADDGVAGPMTRMATQRFIEARGTSDALMLFLAERGEFMAKLQTFDSFGRGWVRRIFANLRYAAEDN